MSKPGIIYRLNWQSFHETTDLQCFIDISDNDNLIDDGDTPQVFDLVPAGNPAELSVIDNDENPFTVILAQQLTIRFNSTTQISMSTFVKGSDQRWSVHYYLGTNTKTIFKGFLVADDNSISEEFLYPPNTVTLTANDGLPLLKDIPLVNADGDNPQGYHKISDYLSWALRKTGMDLSLFAAFNIKSVDDVSDISVENTDPEHFFYVEYLEAKTFEKEIGISISSYEAIEKILKYEARLFQFQGAWWILRVDEVEDATRGIYVTEFDSSGSFVKNWGEFDVRKEIGHIHDILFSMAQTSVTATRANKSVRLNYNFETPLELPCNVDFSRGSNENVISADESRFDLDCWTLRSGFPGSYGSVDGTTLYLKKKYVNGYESERYIVLTPRTTEESGSSQPTYAESEPIYITEKDKFTASVDFRLNLGIATGGGFYRLFRFVLHGDDGSYWVLGRRSDFSGTDTTQQWYDTANFTLFTGWGKTEIDFDTYDEEEFRSLDWDAPAAPVSGNLYIWLNQFNQLAGGDDDKEIWYNNLSFTYYAFINGSYKKYTGQYHTTNQTGDYKKKIEDDVFVSDSPTKLFKGALHEFDGSVYNLSGLFYNAAVFPAGTVDTDFHHRYGEIQLFDVWNQYKNEMRIVQATLQGIDLDKTFTISGDTLPFPAHLITKWNPTDTSTHVANKYFLLLHFNQDHANGGWSGVFREVVNLTVAKDYSNHEFKYIS